MRSPRGGGLAVVLPGGGARAAYQAGVLRALSRHFPSKRPDILTGVSAGGINAAYLASRAALSIEEAVEGLVRVWEEVRSDDVFRVDRPTVTAALSRILRRPTDLAPPAEGGILDTSPLHAFIERHLGTIGQPIRGIGEAIADGHLGAFALTTTSYTTGQSVTWVEGEGVEPWDRPMRRAVRTRLRPEHVLASSALPFFFPAVSVDEPGLGPGWYGDGGIRLTAPLSPALHLGADSILVVTTRYARNAREAAEREIDAYPPLAQVFGVLMNSVFLDVIDRDAQTLQRINELIEAIPPRARGDFRPVRLLVLRPSRDVAKLAGDYEPQLPPAMRFLLRGVGSSETKSPDWLSMLLFEPEYVSKLIALGEADVEAQLPELTAFFRPEGEPA